MKGEPEPMARSTDPANPGVAVDGPAGGADEVADKLQKEQEQGYRGDPVDPTPNENYTVAGVTSGAPTPETDENLAREARDATRLGTTKFDHGDAGETADTGTSSAESGETKLTGDDLQAAVEKHGIDTSTGGSNSDGSMNADEKRAAIAAAEADAGNGAS